MHSMLAGEALAVTDPAAAARLASREADPRKRDMALQYVVRTVLTCHPGELGWCLRTARAISGSSERDRALAAIAEAMAETDVASAARIAGEISNGEEHARVLAHIAGSLAATDPRWASYLAAQADSTVRSSGDGDRRQHILAVVTHATAPLKPALTARCLPYLTSPGWRAYALAALVKAIAPAYPARAAELAADMQHACKQADDPLDSDTIVDAVAELRRPIARNLGKKAFNALRAGDQGPVQRVTRMSAQARVMIAMGHTMSARGLIIRAQRLAETIESAEASARALAEVARSAAPIDPDLALS